MNSVPVVCLICVFRVSSNLDLKSLTFPFDPKNTHNDGLDIQVKLLESQIIYMQNFQLKSW